MTSPYSQSVYKFAVNNTADLIISSITTPGYPTLYRASDVGNLLDICAEAQGYPPTQAVECQALLALVAAEVVERAADYPEHDEALKTFAEELAALARSGMAA